MNGNPDGLPEDLIHLLRYIKSTITENAVGGLVPIHKMVETLKQDKEVQKAEMKFHELIEYERELAKKEGREEEHINTLREKQRADSLERENTELKKKLATLQNI